jgi:hypothetical protein
MKNLYEPATAAEVKARIAKLTADTPAQWGKMNAAQAAAHLAATMEMAVGDSRPPRMFIGRLIGGMVRKKLVGDDRPMGKNSPTAPNLLVPDQRDMDRERARLMSLVERFSSSPAACTTHPHTFFGPMKPEEWAIIMYKHLDHHLRQFAL